MANTTSPAYRIEWRHHIKEIPREAWNALAEPLATPLLEWDWLHLMESSGSMVAQTGWQPSHLTVWADGNLIAAAPLYIKAHSRGEFVFDHAWADLAERIGIRYYPKLVGMSPATPITGYRFLIAPQENPTHLTAIMLKAIDQFCRQHNLAGSSFLFVDPQWRKTLENQPYNCWHHQSFNWVNPGYRSFEDYLAVFNSNQRRNIKRERRAIDNQGLTVQAYQGDAIPDHFFPLMYRLYARTNDQFGIWSCKYLTPEFFTGLADQFRHRLLIMAAFESPDSSSPLAMSLLLYKGKQLLGRYWGCLQQFNALHFNLCYYHPIEWAIENGIALFDPGAGSQHKIRRGFLAVPNYSMHRFYDERLQQVMSQYIDRINDEEQQYIAALNAALPFAHRTTHASGPKYERGDSMGTTPSV